MQIQLPASDQGRPQEKTEWDSNNAEPKQVVSLLVASPQVQNSIFKLSEAWTNPTVKTILLTAPPGAGKEEYVKFLRAGFGTLPEENHEEGLPLPGKNPESVEDYIRKVVSDWNAAQKGKGPEKSSVLFGNTPVVFLDESDKAKRDVRDALLRILSARKLTPTKGSETTTLKDEVFVFTASTIYSELLARVAPRDFWTRVQLTVESAHPLMIGSADDRLWIVEQYVKMFLEKNLVKNEAMQAMTANRYGPSGCEAVKALRENCDMVAEQISEPLSRMCQVRIPSIRVVRTITDKVVWNMLAHGLGGTGQDDGEAKRKSPLPPFGENFELSPESTKKWCNEYVPVFFLESFA